MARVMDKEEAQATERAFENAGFSVEKVGKGKVYVRKLSDKILEATRALITGNGDLSGHRNGETEQERPMKK